MDLYPLSYGFWAAWEALCEAGGYQGDTGTALFFRWEAL